MVLDAERGELVPEALQALLGRAHRRRVPPPVVGDGGNARRALRGAEPCQDVRPRLAHRPARRGRARQRSWNV